MYANKARLFAKGHPDDCSRVEEFISFIGRPPRDANKGKAFRAIRLLWRSIGRNEIVVLAEPEIETSATASSQSAVQTGPVLGGDGLSEGVDGPRGRFSLRGSKATTLAGYGRHAVYAGGAGAYHARTSAVPLNATSQRKSRSTKSQYGIRRKLAVLNFADVVSKRDDFIEW
ncbi:unnamed protein product, partial [Iphiclides podalirius]